MLQRDGDSKANPSSGRCRCGDGRCCRKRHAGYAFRTNNGSRRTASQLSGAQHVNTPDLYHPLKFHLIGSPYNDGGDVSYGWDGEVGIEALDSVNEKVDILDA
ncbi:hypothetical protein OsJ_08546 [Oryza sativa Japonica Group]|uniref:Uncharacterized protein n=1 Tax=Oryza sativa subsp. japonica TaxID=39947 RepID=B9F3G8_ORYSJ|nr:hypothetical protein OsJ_08546 [Oryza sativa Japonica Group]